MGHYCRICGRERANEKFGGRGHKIHVCKDCRQMPKAERERIEIGDELFHFIEQSRISEKNIVRLEKLMGHEDAEIRETAEMLLRLASIAPRKRKRWQKVKAKDPKLYGRFEEIGWTDYPY